MEKKLYNINIRIDQKTKDIIEYATKILDNNTKISIGTSEAIRILIDIGFEEINKAYIKDKCV